jgi:hypothetical protein
MKKNLLTFLLITVLLAGFSENIFAAEADLADAEESVLKNVYYEYIRDNILPIKALVNYDTATAILTQENWHSMQQWDHREGLIGADIVDLDQDGVEELLLYYMTREYSEDPTFLYWTDSDGYMELICANLYTWSESEGVQLQSTQELSYTEDWTTTYLTAGLFNLDGKIWLYTEDYCEANSYLSSGRSMKYTLYEYTSQEGFHRKYRLKNNGGSTDDNYELFTYTQDEDYSVTYIDLSQGIEAGFPMMGLPTPSGVCEKYISYPTLLDLESFQRSFVYQAGGTVQNNQVVQETSLKDDTGLASHLEDPWDFSYEEQKGKTELCLSYAGTEDNVGKDYILQVFSEEGEILKNWSIHSGDSKQYDFSTDLQLPSGTYRFRVSLKEDTSLYWENTYVYDEAEKCDSDDAFGNEREYRRLLSEAASENPLEQSGIWNNMQTRLVNVGLDSSTADKILNTLKEASEHYRNLFLYSFYKYSYCMDGGETAYRPDTNLINFGSSLAGKDGVTTFFHEAGHAIDGNICPGSYYTASELTTIFELMQQDFKNIVSIDLQSWLDDQKITKSDEEKNLLLNKICEDLIGPDNMHLEDKSFWGNSWTKLVVDAPDDLNDEELKAFYAVIDSISSDLRSMKFSNANMAMDVFAGMTNNKVNSFTYGGFLGLLTAYGHGPVMGDDYYWYTEEGVGRVRLVTEPWAEFFATWIVEDQQTLVWNNEYFSTASAYFGDLSETLLTYYKENL